MTERKHHYDKGKPSAPLPPEVVDARRAKELARQRERCRRRAALDKARRAEALRTLEMQGLTQCYRMHDPRPIGQRCEGCVSGARSRGTGGMSEHDFTEALLDLQLESERCRPDLRAGIKKRMAWLCAEWDKQTRQTGNTKVNKQTRATA